MTLAEAPQHLLRKLKREVLKNLSREKRELRKCVNSFDYFLFFFVAFSSALQIPATWSPRAVTSTAGGSRLWRAIQMRKLQDPMRACCSGRTDAAPTGLGIGSISSYKHFAPTALWECDAISRRFHYQDASRRWIRMTNDVESNE